MSTAVLKKNLLTIYLVAIVVAGMLVLYGIAMVSRVQQAQDNWSRLTQEGDSTMHHLHTLQARFGYGGFIDKYRVYMAGIDTSLAPDLLADLDAVTHALHGLAASHMERDQADAARLLQQAIDRYRHNVELRPEDRELGLLRVDEAVAVHALAHLSHHSMEAGSEYRDQAADALNELIRLINLGLVIVVLVFGAALLLVRNSRRLTSAKAEAEDARVYLGSLLEATPDALLIVDERGCIQNVNIAASRLFGYTHEQLLQMSVEQLMPEKFRHGHAAMRERAFSQKHDRPFMVGRGFSVQTAAGYELSVDISISYSQQSSGRLALVALRDITEQLELERLLQERQEMLETAQSIAHIGSWVWHVQEDTFYWSDEVYRVFGLVPGTLKPTYSAFMERIHADDRVRVGAAVAQVLVDDKPYEIEHRVRRLNGEERLVMQRGRLFRDQEGDPLRMVGTIWDITERKLAERELLFDKAIIDGMSQPVVIVTGEGRIDDVNPAYCEMCGYDREELLGRPSNVLKSGRHDKAYYKDLWSKLASDGRWQGEIWIRRKDGVIVPRLLSITTICQPEFDECRYVGFYSDITSLKESEAKLEKLAHFDQLTGLANRMLFHDRLRAAMARAHRSGSRVAVVFIDLDGFKQVNDTLGHRTGDMLLVEVAERMKCTVREDDTVARLGGDEFALVINELASLQDVEELAGRLLGQLQISLGAGKETLSVSASVGIALYPDDGESVTLLLEKADQAMYQAKQSGKNAYLFYAPVPEDD